MNKQKLLLSALVLGMYTGSYASESGAGGGAGAGAERDFSVSAGGGGPVVAVEVSAALRSVHERIVSALAGDLEDDRTFAALGKVAAEACQSENDVAWFVQKMREKYRVLECENDLAAAQSLVMLGEVVAGNLNNIAQEEAEVILTEVRRLYACSKITVNGRDVEVEDERHWGAMGAAIAIVTARENADLMTKLIEEFNEYCSNVGPGSRNDFGIMSALRGIEKLSAARALLGQPARKRVRI